jgi:hypothetical protein
MGTLTLLLAKNGVPGSHFQRPIYRQLALGCNLKCGLAALRTSGRFAQQLPGPYGRSTNI